MDRQQDQAVTPSQAGQCDHQVVGCEAVQTWRGLVQDQNTWSAKTTFHQSVERQNSNCLNCPRLSYFVMNIIFHFNYRSPKFYIMDLKGPKFIHERWTEKTRQIEGWLFKMEVKGMIQKLRAHRGSREVGQLYWLSSSLLQKHPSQSRFPLWCERTVAAAALRWHHQPVTAETYM